ncbi:MAG: S41 family peptidase, partial [Parcubacteria group bacterium]
SGLDFKLFDRVYDILSQEFVDQPVDKKQLEFGMIRGLVAGLGDLNSNFMDPDETKAFQENLSGEFEGIGIEIAIKNEQLTVVAPLPGSPAELAGIEAGDVLVQINETAASSLTLDQAVQLIRGPKGSEVTLLVTRHGKFETREFKIVRDTISIESATSEIREDGIGVIKIARFGEDTYEKVSGFAQKMLESKVAGIVLDLRDNPGGFLQASVDVASLFIPEGTIVSEEYGNNSQKEYKANGNALIKDIPLVVLINEGSASASEIVAGALQDYGRAKLVGNKSFGKGTVQKLETLEQNTSLRLTIARYVLPKGRKIDHVGIDPDVEVDIPNGDQENKDDPQLDKALELLGQAR